MGLLGAVLTAVFAFGGATIGRYAVMKTGIDKSLPMAGVIGPAIGGYVWAILFRKLWTEVVKAQQGQQGQPPA